MALPAEILAVMEDAVYYPLTGTDTVGNNVYGAACVLKVRREGETVSMMTSTGDGGTKRQVEQRSVKLIADYVSPSGLAVKGRLVIGGTEYRVTDVATQYDENGPYYQDVTCSTNKEL